MPKTVVALFLAVSLAGMTGVAPYVGGLCDAGAAAMPGMAMAGMAMGGPEAGAAAAHATMAAEHGRGRSPAPHPKHHGCCCCLGPCAVCAVVALPASAVASLPAPARAPAPAPAVWPQYAGAARGLLPFANGPPSLLG